MKITTMFLWLFAASVLLFVHNVRCETCPDGWSSHQDSCYKYVRETYNWFNAKLLCEEIGGHLAEVGSPEENQYLIGLMHDHRSSQAWLGLNDLETENQFVWTTTKQAAPSTYWRVNEPNNAHGEEDCGAFYGLDWVDYNCEDARIQAICEMAGAVVG